MQENKDYFELGRGAKLIPQQYWHQYVLGIDLSLTEKQFIVMEVGKTEIIYRKQLNIVELAHIMHP
jgi:activator of 2-hydroxyglutaryl-CoA dehydratase